MSKATLVSPYLKRPLRSLQEVLRSRRARGPERRVVYGASEPDPLAAQNSNLAAPDRQKRKSA